ncbi:hypothetical protein HPB51_020840 [Rhipicephalus microplus]|uniref:Uncharacterized protein n=1 Tax=Rhipicephalus microplus TaxID=6941 RepID=A0A9J6EBX0_RHIMP|nr:hypothetical protein HPB51_020840 [Rhipicephalus microplus]
MQHRVSKQNFNKKLQKKSPEVNRKIETHCSRLCEQEWEELSNTMDEYMSAGRTWKILKQLLDPASSKMAVRTKIAKWRHKYEDDPEALRDEIVRTHLTRPEGLEKEHRVYWRT